ncbi:cupin domain-containing protein [Exercitatus varius]|uniref:cupin domain-containing protein n=1 Tax=Exercitatus varius TaxID=67857 RepID=UPI00294B507E|nr:cupin domain-containing protein [Exercitatus varius]MDG2957985.1 cupin domain-containing protein [Exercitatus varius]MDG2962897.1 cupin domain-containing protein [Exercitatus varius]
MSQFCLPESISAEIFLRDYWQKRPLVMRNALPEIVGMFEPQDILELARSEEVTARLVRQYNDDDWRVKLSPLNAEDFADLPEKWSVLVQNLEQWSVELGEMWNRFGFIPQWQRDDIMVSFAPQGGSVGKHYDEYDVFLVQGYGQRRWQLGKWCDPSTAFKPNQPIRIFDDMGELVLDEVMNPGDVLYIPSRMAHYGVAESDCLTFSFGLRYPNISDLTDKINEQFNRRDPEIDFSEFMLPLRLNQREQPTGKLGEAEIRQMKAQFFQRLANSEPFDRLFRRAVAGAVTTRRYDLLISDEMSDPDEVRSEMERNFARLQQDNNCKLAYLTAPLEIYANGEWLDELNELEKAVLKRLADGEKPDFTELKSLAQEVNGSQEDFILLFDSICNWLDDGWVLLV